MRDTECYSVTNLLEVLDPANAQQFPLTTGQCCAKQEKEYGELLIILLTDGWACY